MIQLLENMLSILKRKLVNKLIYLIIFFLFTSFVFSKDCIKQGELVSIESILSISLGMHKNDVLKTLGNPMLVSPYNVDCICYYFYFFSSNVYEPIKRRYIVLFFNESLLSSYFFRF